MVKATTNQRGEKIIDILYYFTSSEGLPMVALVVYDVYENRNKVLLTGTENIVLEAE